MVTIKDVGKVANVLRGVVTATKQPRKNLCHQGLNSNVDPLLRFKHFLKRKLKRERVQPL